MTADVVVVGAGVIGLTTAVCLAESGRDVLVRAAEPTAETTSMVAGAMTGLVPAAEDDPMSGWGAVSAGRFLALTDDPRTGVHVMRGRLVSDWGTEPPPWAAALPGFGPLSAEERAGFAGGFWAELPFVDMSRYLPWLGARLTALGGRVEIETVRDLRSAARGAGTVVNCTGTGARDLVPDPDVRAVKGQHVTVANPGLTEFFFEGGNETGAWTGYFPHGNHVVLGGVAIDDDWDRTPDDRVTEQILQRCIAVEPRFADASVLRVDVGLRPLRASPRVEAELRGDVRVVHNYGHGGLGVTLSWGTAQEAAALATAS